MKIRLHRGGYDESMATIKQIQPTLEAVVGYVQTDLPVASIRDGFGRVEVKPYGYDERNGWDTHVVMVHGYGVFAFTDGPPKPLASN